MKRHKTNKQNDILFILISSFVVVVAWISFSIYHIRVTSTVSQHIQYQLSPIDSTFNPQTIQLLKGKEDINPLFESQSISSQSANSQQNQNIVQISGKQPQPSVTPTNSQLSRFAPTNIPINRQGQ